jgi:hypothetical protein
MSESTPSNAAPHTANPDIASLYLATIVTIDDHGTWRPAHDVNRCAPTSRGAASRPCARSGEGTQVLRAVGATARSP